MEVIVYLIVIFAIIVILYALATPIFEYGVKKKS